MWRIIVIAFSAFLLLACTGGSMAAKELGGIVYIGISQQLVAINLDSHESTVLFEDPTRVVSFVIKLDDRRILFGVDKLGLDPLPVLHVLDRTSNKVVVLYDASASNDGTRYIGHPVFLKSKKRLYFYGTNKRHLGLYWADINTLGQSHLIHDNLSFEYPLVAISDHEVAYYDGNNLEIFDADLNSSVPTKLSTCIPYLWRSATKQLLCSEGDSFRYFLTNLEGSSVSALKDLNNHIPLLYVNEVDEAIFNGISVDLGGTGLKEGGDLWIYNFKKDALIKLVHDVRVPTDALIWYPR